MCVGTAVTTPPVVATARPITPATATLTGTATAGATVLLYVNGLRYSTVPATSGNYTFSTAAGTLPALAVGQQLTVTALVANTSCESTPVTLNVVTNRAISPPIVNSPLVSGATIVSGTSSEAPGSTINLTTYASTDGTGAVAATYTPTVLSNGTWSVAVAALAGGSVKATVTTTDYGTSGFSNVVPVQTRTASTPVISGSYTERGTSVSGTSAAAVGSSITVYEDGDVIGTTTVQTGGTWTITSLSDASGVSPNTLYPTLYAGGVLTATATEPGKLASPASAPVTVGCVSLANKSFSTTDICQNSAASYTIANVEPGVVYTLQDATSGSNVATGVSRVGTGTGSSSLVILTSVLTTPGTYSIKVNAFSVGAVNCSQTTTTAISVTVNPLPAIKPVAAQRATVGPNNAGTNITVASSESGVTYQLLNASVTPNTLVGNAQPGTGNTLNLPTGAITSSTTYAVAATSAYPCSNSMGNVTVTYSTTPLPVELVAFEAVIKNSDAVLNWRTASEKNNDRFEVERSFDGRTFTWIGQKNGQGSSAQPHDYQFVDPAITRYAASHVYYRLRQVDATAEFSFSPVRSVRLVETSLPAQVLLYPNPTSANVSIDLRLLPTDRYTVQVLSLTGQTLSTALLDAGQVHELAVAGLPAGMYVVRVQSARLSLTQSMVKLR